MDIGNKYVDAWLCLSLLERNRCLLNPCRNGGICSTDEKKPVCSCREGFVSEFCQGELEDFFIQQRENTLFKNAQLLLCLDHVCKPSPCLHGGICKTKAKGKTWQFQCSCPKSFTGKICEGLLTYYNPTACELQKCDERSMQTLSKIFTLEKVISWSHYQLIIQFDSLLSSFLYFFKVASPCMSKPCMHGRCIDATNDPRYTRFTGGYLCLCEKGYTGKNCRSRLSLSWFPRAK